MTSGTRDPSDAVFDQLLGAIKMGKSLEQWAADAVMLGLDDSLIDAATLQLEARARATRIKKIPRTLHDPGTVTPPWYPGPTDGDRCWPALRSKLLDAGFGATALEQLDTASSKIVGYLAPPSQDQIETRGLVLGYVQSGKTSNFTAVIAKAADIGYRFIVVLSGIHNSLRGQTQQRLDEQLFVANQDLWFMLTTPTGDFGNQGNVEAILTSTDNRALCVVKKNKHRLQNLIRWLRSASDATLRNCPVLVIDDEADQASVNTAEEREQRSAINRLLVDLLEFPKVAYVGYTATPFANLFVDPGDIADIYPRDFIVDLPRPKEYFGPEQIFGRDRVTPDDEVEFDGFDMVRRVPNPELSVLQPPRAKAKRQEFEPELTPSLVDAFRYFVLATAARWARGQAGEHSTMLVHTTMYTDTHELFRAPLLALRSALRAEVEGSDPVALNDLRSQWERETEAVPADEFDELTIAFDQLVPHLAPVLDSLSIVLDNYRSTERLVYGDTPRVVVVVGGNTLSRGLTLEGLIVSFFVRAANAYDTLLQMGRWFGYRRGYADLPRIWITEELEEFFRLLATVEAEIRIDVARYELEDVTPQNYATKIRTHPGLAITSEMKMRRAISRVVDYGDRRVQSFHFNHENEEWLRNNLAAGKALVKSAHGGSSEIEELGNGRTLITGVPVASIRTFLGAYRFHETHADLRSDLLLSYITLQNSENHLIEWNVVIMGKGDDKLGTVDLGLDEPVPLIRRSKMKTSQAQFADIKSLMSTVDRVVDLGLSVEETRNQNDADLQLLRAGLDVGLLLLYPIDRTSVPTRGQKGKRRVALDAVEDVLGAGLVFPPSKVGGGVEYVSVGLWSELPQEDVDFDPDFDAEEDAQVEGPGT